MSTVALPSPVTAIPAVRFHEFGQSTQVLLSSLYIYNNNAKVIRNLAYTGGRRLGLTTSVSQHPLSAVTGNRATGRFGVTLKEGVSSEGHLVGLNASIDTEGDASVGIDTEGFGGLAPGISLECQNNAELAEDSEHHENHYTRIGYKSRWMAGNLSAFQNVKGAFLKSSAALTLENPFGLRTAEKVVLETRAPLSEEPMAKTKVIPAMPVSDSLSIGGNAIMDITSTFVGARGTRYAPAGSIARAASSGLVPDPSAPATSAPPLTTPVSRPFLHDYAVGAQYLRDGDLVSLTTRNAMRGWQARWHSRVSAATAVGAQFDHIPSEEEKGPKYTRVLEAGASYRSDPVTLWKAKMNTRGMVGTAVQRTLSPSFYTSLAGEWDLRGAGAPSSLPFVKPARFGISLVADF